jgi:hypothetical protein
LASEDVKMLTNPKIFKIQNFIHYDNNAHPSKPTHEISTTKITLLDTATKLSNGIVLTEG